MEDIDKIQAFEPQVSNNKRKKRGAIWFIGLFFLFGLIWVQLGIIAMELFVAWI